MEARSTIDTPSEKRGKEAGRRGGLGFWGLARRIVDEVMADHVGAYAGSLTFKSLVGLFPFLFFLVSVFGILQSANLAEGLDAEVTQWLSGLPDDAESLLHDQIETLQNSDTSAFTFGAVLSILLALWGISGGVRTVMDSMNVMYGVQETRPIVGRYLFSVVLAVGAVVLLVAALVLVVKGGSIGQVIAEAVGLGEAFDVAWSLARWPVLVAFVLVAFALIYYYAPDVEQKFRWVSPGSIIALLLWLLFTTLFSMYVNEVGLYGKTYGVFAGLIVFMLYVYYTSFILLIGAEINQVIEANAAGGKDEGEKVPDAD